MRVSPSIVTIIIILRNDTVRVETTVFPIFRLFYRIFLFICSHADLFNSSLSLEIVSCVRITHDKTPDSESFNENFVVNGLLARVDSDEHYILRKHEAGATSDTVTFSRTNSPVQNASK